jgi:hypothetical protein
MLYAVRLASGGYLSLDEWGDVGPVVPALADAAMFDDADAESLTEAFVYAQPHPGAVVVEVIATYAEGAIVPDPETGEGDDNA